MSVWVQEAGVGSQLATLDIPEQPPEAAQPSQADEDYERAMRTYQQIMDSTVVMSAP
jgi:hypothetical protein